jgi:hypothetical protein
VIVYRVFPYDAKARPGTPGHPMYLHRPQGRGRLDNPTVYDTWYVALSPECAVGEVFGDLSSWSAEMFTVPYLPGGRRALGLYEVDAGIPILDLDDPKVLVERGLRPTQVVSRNRSVSQGWALSIFHETKSNADRRWAGVRSLVVVSAAALDTGRAVGCSG